MNGIKRLVLTLARVFFAAGMTYIAIWPLTTAVKTEHYWIFNYPGLFPLALVGGLLLGFIISVAVHEVGHVVAGKRAGFRFAFLLFWPVQIRRRGAAGLTIRPMFKSGLGLGGMAGMAPVNCNNLRQGYLKLLRGGPMASFILGFAGILISLAAGLGSSLTGGAFWMVGVLSLLLFTSCMIPRVTAGYLSDGAAIRLLSRGDNARVDLYVAGLEAATLTMAGTRPRELPTALLERLMKAEAGDPMWHRARYFNFLAAADRDDLGLARSYMDEIHAESANIPLLLRTTYEVRNAWLLAREGKPTEARVQLRSVRGGLVEPCCVAMVEATILAAEGKSEEAAELSKSVPGLIQKSMLPEAQEFIRVQAERLQMVNASG